MKKLILTLLTTLATLVVLLPAPSHAETVRVRDERDDGPPGLDIRRASYTNTGRNLGGVIRVADLRRRGKASIQIVTADGDYKELNLYVRVRKDGSLRSWARRGGYSMRTVPCDVRAHWNRELGRIPLFIRVPCLRRWRGTSDMDYAYTFPQAWTFGRNRADSAPTRRVHRS